MNELALFIGGGGGALGSRLLGHRIVGAVESNPYCREIIMRRQEEGYLSAFPIWDDIRTFDGRAWCGYVDIVTAGFPCQPFSCAGKRKGAADERNCWPDTFRVIQEVRARYVMLENVPGIRKYLPIIIRDLRRAEYAVERPLVVAAAAVGAGHIRKRVWIFAYDTSECVREQNEEAPAEPRERTRLASVGVSLRGKQEVSADSLGGRQREQQGRGTRQKRSFATRHSNPNETKFLAEHKMRRRRQGREGESRQAPGRWEPKTQPEPTRVAWFNTEPRLARLVYRPANRVDRIRATGNAQVPAVVKKAWEILTGGQRS